MTHKVREMNREDELKEAFNVLNKDKDGKLKSKELKYFMRKVAHLKLSSEEAEAMIEFAESTTGSGVSFEDFKEVVAQSQLRSDAFEGDENIGASVDDQ